MNKQESISVFPLSRVKKIIQQNADIGKIQHTVPFVVSKSLELFLEDLIKECVNQQEKQQKNKLVPYDLKQIIQQNENLSFLNDLVKDIPDLEQNKSKSKSCKKTKVKFKKQKCVDEQKKKPTKKVKKYQEECEGDDIKSQE